MTERYFTPAEVEALIPELTEIMERVVSAHTEAMEIRERLRAEQERITFSGGGLIDTAAWGADREQLEERGRTVEEGLRRVMQLGGVPKDLSMGLIDFRHRRRGRDVNLCWKYGEREIRFWHGLDEGYAARKPL